MAGDQTVRKYTISITTRVSLARSYTRRRLVCKVRKKKLNHAIMVKKKIKDMRARRSFTDLDSVSTKTQNSMEEKTDPTSPSNQKFHKKESLKGSEPLVEQQPEKIVHTDPIVGVLSKIIMKSDPAKEAQPEAIEKTCLKKSKEAAKEDLFQNLTKIDYVDTLSKRYSHYPQPDPFILL